MISDPIADLLTRIRNANLGAARDGRDAVLEAEASRSRASCWRRATSPRRASSKGEPVDELVITLKYGDERASA